MPAILGYWPFCDPVAVVAIVVLLAMTPWRKRRKP